MPHGSFKMGCGASIVFALMGAAAGWFGGGAITDDPHIWLLLGFAGGGLVGFMFGGPRGSGAITGIGAIGAIAGFLVAGYLTQDQGLGAVMWAWSGGAIGLIVGVIVGVILMSGASSE